MYAVTSIGRLTKKQRPWDWTPECEDAVQKVKNKILQPPVLTFYNCVEDQIVQVDSSQVSKLLSSKVINLSSMSLLR